ncbi:response regulator transcription factor [Micromonospora sp. NPDC049102]|uniref:response regulator n=1 Tax=Micromonospora sp. NPDC049102 TaxID=3364265 RepID=UPI00371F855A
MRVVVAEDLVLLRDGLIRLLEAHGFEVVAAVGTGPDLLTELVNRRPDVAVVDVRLPPTYTDEGLRAALAARAEVPGLPVLVLSAYVERLYARELLADGHGGIGYLLKDRVSDLGEFVDAVRRVAAAPTRAVAPAYAVSPAGSTPSTPACWSTVRSAARRGSPSRFRSSPNDRRGHAPVVRTSRPTVRCGCPALRPAPAEASVRGDRSR